jgi:hypothetical protein
LVDGEISGEHWERKGRVERNGNKFAPKTPSNSKIKRA